MQKKKFVGAILIIGSILILGFLALNPRIEQNVDSNNQQPAREMAAALVDSLYVSDPNSDFTFKLNQTLSEAGFAVDVYQGKQVTVDLLKKLPANYDLLILRMHSAVHSKSLGLYLFTAEPYVQEKYVEEQYFFLVKKAYAFNDSNPVFAVNWGFIKRCMTGKFNGTLVIVMGCDGALDPFMAEEFFNQGATAYIAWNDMVLPSHSDKATLQLIQNLYIQKLTLQQAVDRTNEQVVPDPNHNSTLTLILPHG
jgi:hypothetical protein